MTAPLGGERVNTAQHPCYRLRLHSARPRLVIRSLRPSSGHPQGTTKARARPTLTTQPLPCPRPPRPSTATARRYRRCCAWYCAPTACGITGHTRYVFLSVNVPLSICVDLIYVCVLGRDAIRDGRIMLGRRRQRGRRRFLLETELWQPGRQRHGRRPLHQPVGSLPRGTGI